MGVSDRHYFAWLTGALTRFTAETTSDLDGDGVQAYYALIRPQAGAGGLAGDAAGNPFREPRLERRWGRGGSIGEQTDAIPPENGARKQRHVHGGFAGRDAGGDELSPSRR